MKLYRRKLAPPLLYLAVGLVVFGWCYSLLAQDSVGIIDFGGMKRQKKQSPFAVGIVEANGNLVPVATFNGVYWSSPDLVRDWKRGGESLGEWTLWYENPGPSPEDPSRAWRWIDRLSPARIGIGTTGLVGSEMLCSRKPRSGH